MIIFEHYIHIIAGNNLKNLLQKMSSFRYTAK